jgi:hypothetical protein
MEALIHHFKLFTEGFRVPPGDAYVPVESPRGELGCYIVSDGTSRPYRLHVRAPSFANLQGLAPMARGGFIPDVIACISSIDPVMGDGTVEGRLGPGQPPRQGSLTVARLTEDNVARARELLALYPQKRSALVPVLHLLQEQDGYLSPEGIEHVAELLDLKPTKTAAWPCAAWAARGKSSCRAGYGSSRRRPSRWRNAGASPCTHFGPQTG